jgi:type IV secretion system protein VirB1
MAALPLAAVLALAGACQSAVSPGTIARIAQHESGLQPFALHDNTANQSFFPETKPEAYRLASGLIAAGHSLDVGLAQINTANFMWLDLSLATALDPCTNIKASAAVLVGYSKYNTGSPTRGIANGYAAAVQAVRVADLESAATPPATDPDAPPAWDVWATQEYKEQKTKSPAPVAGDRHPNAAANSEAPPAAIDAPQSEKGKTNDAH